MMCYPLRRLLILPLMLALTAVVFALLPVVGTVQESLRPRSRLTWGFIAPGHFYVSVLSPCWLGVSS